MTDAPSKFGRELAALGGLLVALAAPFFFPLTLLVGSPHASPPPDWVLTAFAVIPAGMVLFFFAGVARRTITLARRRRNQGSPLHRLQDWKEDGAVAAPPEPEDYDLWRGTLVDRISIWLNPPLHKLTASVLRVLTLLTSLLWLLLCIGLLAPGVLDGFVNPYDPSVYDAYVGTVAILTGIVVLGNAWLWASRTRGEINRRATSGAA